VTYVLQESKTINVLKITKAEKLALYPARWPAAVLFIVGMLTAMLGLYQNETTGGLQSLKVFIGGMAIVVIALVYKTGTDVVYSLRFNRLLRQYGINPYNNDYRVDVI
jgi:hypothetical protein